MSSVFQEAGRRAIARLDPPVDRYIDDPVGWAERKTKRFLWSKQKEILESVRDNRYTAVPSCHGPGKSFTASECAAWWVDAHPKGEAFVVSTAPTDNQVKSILWREIGRRHSEAGLPGYVTKEAKWYASGDLRESELVGFGRKPQDYDEGAFQGIHEKYVLVIVDEAGGVPKNLFDALETLMTNDFARMLAIGNPDDPASYFETICRPGSGWNVIKIDAFSTPNFTGEYVPQAVAERLVTPMWVGERAQKWGMTSPLYQSKVLAMFPEISDDTLIQPGWVRRSMERDLAGLGIGCFAYDIARFGTNETVGYRNRDGKIRRSLAKHKQDTHTTANQIALQQVSVGPDFVPAIIDIVGVGGGVYDQLRAREFNVIPFDGQERALEPKRFADRRAEVYWKMRTAFEENRVDLDPLDDVLHSQMQSIKWYVDRHGKIHIESKDDMKRRRMPSPDRADAVMMTFSFDTTRTPQVFVAKTITGHLMKEVM